MISLQSFCLKVLLIQKTMLWVFRVILTFLRGILIVLLDVCPIDCIGKLSVIY